MKFGPTMVNGSDAVLPVMAAAVCNTYDEEDYGAIPGSRVHSVELRYMRDLVADNLKKTTTKTPIDERGIYLYEIHSRSGCTIIAYIGYFVRLQRLNRPAVHYTWLGPNENQKTKSSLTSVLKTHQLNL
jgi:hypothetical protein